MTAASRYTLFLLTLIVSASAIMLIPGIIGISTHIGDVLHALDASYRMADGELPHVDFMTPIGMLAFAPIALFLKLGFAPGASLVLSNVLVSLVYLPAIVWVGISRFQGKNRWVFGTVMVIFLMAFVYGGTSSFVSFSMHYNRWSWVAAFLALGPTVFPSKLAREHMYADALVIGLGLSALALLKMTFFLAFGAAILLILLIDRRFKLLALVFLVGMAVFGIITVMFGPEFWFAYADNLLFVTTAAPRPRPDRFFIATIVAPDRLLGTAIYLFSIIFLRGTGFKRAGLILMLLAPAFAYVVFQNWGNEQKWLVFLGLVLVANMPATGVKTFRGLDARQVTGVLVVACAAIFLPTLVAMTTSFFSLTHVDKSISAPVPFAHTDQDIWLPRSLSFRGMAYRPMPDIGEFSDEEIETDQEQSFLGEILPRCRLKSGSIYHDIRALNLLEKFPEAAHSRIVVADNMNDLWMLSDVKRVKGTAPWYYGGTYGYENAQYFMIPHCALLTASRGESVKAMEASGWDFEEVGRSDAYTLYKIIR